MVFESDKKSDAATIVALHIGKRILDTHQSNTQLSHTTLKGYQRTNNQRNAQGADDAKN